MAEISYRTLVLAIPDLDNSARHFRDVFYFRIRGEELTALCGLTPCRTP
jgi:hypothetical protein